MGDTGAVGREAQPAMVAGRTMAVLYGSELGSAEDIAVELAKMAERLHFQATVDEMDSFKLADVLRSSLVIFVTSTTGQGDMPKNTLKFWKNLRREKLNNTNCLSSLRFAIFGLGDSSYLKFNWSARKLRARLLQLGATEFFRPGEGDERHDNGIDSIYLPWYQELKTTLLADYPLPESITPIPDHVQLPPKYPLQLLPSMATDGKHDDDAGARQLTEIERRFFATRTKSARLSHVDHIETPADRDDKYWRRLSVNFPAHDARRDPSWERENPRLFSSLDKDNILNDHPEKYLMEPLPNQLSEFPPTGLPDIPHSRLAVLAEQVRVTPADHWQDVRHLTFDVLISDKDFANLKEFAGNLVLVIYPKNFPEDVDELIRQMGWEAEADTPLEAKRVPRKLYAVSPTPTLRQLLIHTLDITAVPKRSFIRDLIHFTQDERERERLQELIISGNEQEFYDYTSRPRRTILEILRDFGGVKIPLGRVLDIFPVIRGREFSVCNGALKLTESQGVSFTTLEILAAIVEYKTIIRKPRQGLCSRYLKQLPVGTELTVLLKRSSGPRLVPNPLWAKRPLIAIATGTGIAPIRAVIHERNEQKLNGQKVEVGEGILFYGCRNRAADFHFKNEWESYSWLRVYPAFSRDSIEPDPRTTKTAGAGVPHPPGDSLTQAIALVHQSPPQYDAHKNYVQHLIRKHAPEVAALLLQKPIICICGNAGRMPLSVRAALLDVLVITKLVRSVEDAERWFANSNNVTIWQETW